MRDVEFHFEDKNFIVVGASSGMGKQIALDLAEAGANVLSIARNVSRLEELRAEYPEKINVVSLDVLKADKRDWEGAIQPFVEAKGKLHGGVYTVGITGMSPLQMLDDRLARDIFDTSFWGMINLLQCATRKKYAETGASFVVFSSTAAYWGIKGQFAYSGAKAAVKTAVRSIAKEISRKKQRINSISPGWVETPMTKNFVQETTELPEDVLHQYYLGLGQPKDVSGMTLFLLSDAARWITGTDVVVDGGFLLGNG
ncbi:SDR family oxidoreductase [Anaerovibrio sp.]|uniref:SDR family NAD(P)-dependent oxidoreductase n=1 Tax=Anaerovibrio sp. TaxID=1872532 RepID=UPI0025BA01B6|nr:SDR family oxidoreductase [Anaerovibrio sp.]MBR2141993.1 SDR family oxidoreductase [Anaerovibrio sp.]